MSWASSASMYLVILFYKTSDSLRLDFSQIPSSPTGKASSVLVPTVESRPPTSTSLLELWDVLPRSKVDADGGMCGL